MDEDMTLWKRRARSFQQSCCDSLGDRVYDKVNEEQLVTKVGYALFNAPSEVDETNNSLVYTKGQQHQIKLICEKIKSLHPLDEDKYYISFLYVLIRLKNKNNDEGAHVLFRIPNFKDGKSDLKSYVYIDPKPRRYESWDDYIQKNKLPKCYMCYPLNGVYSVTDGSVDICFGMSPACATRTAIFTGLDVSSTVLMVGATGVGLASLAVPIATPVVWGAAATVLASGSYDTARNVYRLHDIKKHDESLGLKNPDSRSAWLSLAGSVVGMASIGTTVIAKGVVATESAISRAGIITLRVLNISSLNVSGVGVINGIVTLVMKYVNGQLETADILEFITCCLFFVNAIVSYRLASQMIEELASSDLTNLLNLRQNSNFSVTKDVLEFTDSGTYNILRQLLIGCTSRFSLDISVDDLESLVLKVVGLLVKLNTGQINWIKFSMEMKFILQKIWTKYEHVILRVIEEIKITFDVQYWQKILPKQESNNLEVPRHMCEEIDRVIEFCGIQNHSQEQKQLMNFARAFSMAHNSTNREYMNRFQFYCDCVIAQFREEREVYESKLDTQSSLPDFDRATFDKAYGIKGSKNEYFFSESLNKVNHPDFLGNIDELYENFPRTDKTNTQLPHLKTTKSRIYTICGPLQMKKLPDSFYWEQSRNLTTFEVNCNNSSMNREDGLVIIQPNIVLLEEASNTKLEAILIHTSYINECHMGFLCVILQ